MRNYPKPYNFPVARTRLDDVSGDKVASDPRELTTDDILNWWRDEAKLWKLSKTTIHDRYYRLRAFLNWVGGVERITPDTVRAYLVGLVSETNDDLPKVKESTANGHRKTIKSFCEWAIHAGLMESNPVKGIPGFRENDAPTRIALPHEVAALRDISLDYGQSAEFKARNLAYLLLTADTGIRNSEALGRGDLPGIRLPDVYDGRTVADQLVIHAKGGEWRMVSICDEVRVAIDNYILLRRALPNVDHLFVDIDGRAWKPDAARRMMAKLCEKAGLRRLSPHDMRKFFDLALIQLGESRDSRMTIMGHKDVRTAQRYEHEYELRVAALQVHRRSHGLSVVPA